VDVARPESATARAFGKDVSRWIAAWPGGDAAPVRRALEGWKANHAVLEPILAASPAAAEARGLSKDLSAVALLAHEALDHLALSQRPPAAWSEKAQALLQAASKPRSAELELGVLPHVRKLVRAAQNLESWRGLPAAERNTWLEQ
jgi:hypothetical protein